MMRLTNGIRISGLAACLAWGAATQAEPLLNFPFNEGTGSTTTDTVSGLVGVLGTAHDPEVDTVQLVDESPSGQPGDRSIITAGRGFLLADDSATQSLDITEGPITMETWMFIDPNTPAPNAEGILAYGGSYKMGLRSGLHVFTLYGIVDVVNNAAGPVPAGEWVHLAAAWEPGVGVYFYVNGVESFEPDPNLAARPIQHNYLSIASEGFGNSSVATFDRMRIHHALLTAEQIDSVAATPKEALPSTLVSYDFNVPAFPATNAVSPELPTILAGDILPSLTGPAWTSDTPSGAEGDFALSFLTENPPIKEVATVDTSVAPLDLGINNISYTLQSWIKPPTGPLEERRVIFRSNGTAPRVSLSINANRTLHTTILGTADFTTSVPLPNDNQWHHIAVVMEDFDQLHFYLDGVLRQTVTRTQTGAPSGGGAEQLLIGKESETRYFRGLLDRVIIHNHALTQAELDFPAAPGFPTFDALESHPEDVLATAGETVFFNATPTSLTAANYQWFFRKNIGDTGAALTGETEAMLTLDGVTTANEGYYYLEVTNEAGTTYSYPAKLTLRPSLNLTSTGFEAPEYTSGQLDVQNGWRTDFAETVRVRTSAEIEAALGATGVTTGEMVHGGDQALLVRSAGTLTVASTTIRPVTGYEDDQNLTINVWVRPLLPGTSNMGTGNTFLTVENSEGTRAAAVRAGPSGSLDYGTEVQGVWQPTGSIWDGDSWYNIRFELDYSTRTYDMFIDGAQVNSSGPIPFYNPGSDSFAQLRIFRGNNQAGMILDDLSVTGAGGGGDEPSLAIREQDGALVISWPATVTDFTLQATDELAPANWATVPHSVQGDENQAVIQLEGESRFFRLIRN